jgi:polyphenol oxidase
MTRENVRSSHITPEPIQVDRFPLPHGFFTRRGGVSTGPFDSLNCSLSSQDNRESVMENRGRVADAFDVPRGSLLGCTQVHGISVAHVEAPWEPGTGPRADAMVTSRSGLALGVITADCAPVLFADPEARIAGAAHAGWRGAVAGVIEATIAEMVRLGARPKRIVAAVGPCIGQTSYEVATDLRDEVLSRSADDARFFVDGHRDGRWRFDLPGYCAARLSAAGVGEVMVTGIDTLAEEDRFFSHRRRTLMDGGPIGHQISVIAID